METYNDLTPNQQTQYEKLIKAINKIEDKKEQLELINTLDNYTISHLRTHHSTTFGKLSRDEYTILILALYHYKNAFSDKNHRNMKEYIESKKLINKLENWRRKS